MAAATGTASSAVDGHADAVLAVHVSPSGSDRHPGTADRPLATLAAALRVMRQRRSGLKPEARPTELRIVLHEGRHMLGETLQLTAEDSGLPPVGEEATPETAAAPLRFVAAAGARPVVSGGKVITGWKATRVHGRTAWVASLPAVKAGRWSFAQLWVNDRRAQRPRLPEHGLFQIEQPLEKDRAVGRWDVFNGHKRFRYRPGDLRAFRNLDDAEFVALHFWIESRIPLASIDEASREAVLAYTPRMRLTDDHADAGAFYYMDNVFEALRRPGQWYLDRAAGKLYYLPRRGETLTNTTVIAPVLGRLMCLQGDAENNRFVEHVEFEGITFSHNEYVLTEADIRSTPQAACQVFGAVQLDFARQCRFHKCAVEHVGSYGIEFRNGVIDCAVTRCHLHDLAAGGVKVFHATLDPDLGRIWRDQAANKGLPWRGCQRVTVADCHIHDGGHRFRQAAGVLVGLCSGVEVVHNHIHDFDYTGVSVGWCWGYHRCDSFGNIVEWNHIHDIGRGVLSDMGAIYTLGVQTGSRIRYNLIHDVQARGYGGWGIYPDEGSANILIEFNVTARTKHAGISQHYGENNLIRNNIIAFPGEQAAVGYSRVEPGRHPYCFEHNVVFTEHADILSSSYNVPIETLHPGTFRHNLYFNTAGKKLRFRALSFRQWQAAGKDRGSRIADPRFRNPRKLDFRLKQGSPLPKLGFIPFDLSDAGVRPQ